jgi:hypothetical protein
MEVFMKKCPNELGIYDSQIYLDFPKHMYEENGGYYKTKYGCSVDICMVEEILALWQCEIVTLNCCCGHGLKIPTIITMEKDINKMLKLGYKQFVKKDIFIAKSRHIF